MAVGTPSYLFDEERLSPANLTDFRCDKCLARWPLSQHVFQDGLHVCKPNHAVEATKDERDVQRAKDDARCAALDAEEEAEAARLLAEAPNWSLMEGVPLVESIAAGAVAYPEPFALAPGGAVAVTVTGYNLTSTDVIEYSTLSLSHGSVVISGDQTAATFTVTAHPAIVRSDYDFLYNGARYPRAFRIR
jgi:hypothetical protein